ncbi:hypothetical protein PVK06_028649 [Gossypium arboreum]|uniref:Uncharacterized protein n=1 Tax=Gossypium arboreum TaxID=29729 RepID=A0ABR0P3K6_GOSAR|nr:hypothetical protein PVK06_028649 [Gossypium arboreum]
MFIPRALSSNKIFYKNNRWLLPSTVVLDVISNPISSISEPPTVCVATREQMGNCTGNQTFIHRTCVPYGDKDSFRGWFSMDAICRGRDCDVHTIMGYRTTTVVRVKCSVNSFSYGRVARWRSGIEEVWLRTTYPEPSCRHQRSPQNRQKGFRIGRFKLGRKTRTVYLSVE